ncbi:MAG TPA: hypothetical protein VJT85_11365 [Gemmatimonadaceae bacterium]|nr:hypothetical protein [Gemmatimonadaceae bacterium]
MTIRRGAALICVALALGTSAEDQTDRRLLRVDGPMESYEIDGDAGFVGEYHALRPGKHTVKITGVERHRLTVTMNVGRFGVRLADRSVVDACAGGADSGQVTTEVRSWSADVAPDSRAEGGSVLRIREPTLDVRTRAASACEPPCCEWTSRAKWRLNVTSTPAGASVAAGGTYLGSTDARVDVPYGVTERGEEEDIHVRIYKPGFIGCTFLLSELKKDRSNDIVCHLISPVATSTRSSRP